jgi:hypothetical protein
VGNPCKDVLTSDINENGAIGDFTGLDNDGDGLYDQAGFDCGPAARVTAIDVEGHTTRVTWETMGGRSDTLESASAVDGTYLNVGSGFTVPGVGPVTTHRVDMDSAPATSMRSYRVSSGSAHGGP